MNADMFAELQRRAPEVDCMIAHDSQEAEQVNVYYQGEPLGVVLDGGTLITCAGYTDDPKRNDAYFKLQTLVNDVREYVDAYQHGGYPAYAKLPEGYLSLTNYNRIFLAATKMKSGGYQFATWQLKGKGRTGFYDGHYTTDYKAAKRDFAIRSGLVDKSQIFLQPELQTIQNAVQYTIENRSDMDIDLSKQLQSISLKLADALPELNMDEPTPEANRFEQTM